MNCKQYRDLAASFGPTSCHSPHLLNEWQHINNTINSDCLQETRSPALDSGFLDDGLQTEFTVPCIRVWFIPFASLIDSWHSPTLKIKYGFSFAFHIHAQLVESFISAIFALSTSCLVTHATADFGCGCAPCNDPFHHLQFCSNSVPLPENFDS
jgi:hypothetical protein